MRVRALLAELRDRGIFLRSESGEIVCSAPEGALTEDLKQRLLVHRVALLKFLEQGAGGTRRAARIVQRDPRARLPLSLGQESLWISLQGGMAPSAFNLPAAFWLKGPLRVDLLEESLRGILARHESLRTSIQLVDGVPEQKVHAQVALPLQRVDLRGLPRSERRAVAQQRMAEDAGRAFDLAAAPLARFALYQLDEQEFALYLVACHMVWDGWSFDVFLDELATHYEALENGRMPELTPLGVQYGDYTVWQRDWIGGDDYARQLAHWKQRLAGSLPVLNLPTDRPRPPRQSFIGGSCESMIPAGIARAVSDLARRHGCTPFMVLSTAFNVLLHRWSGQDEVVIGYPQAGVDTAEQERMIGFFVNTLVMRTAMGDDPTVLDLLKRVKADLLGSASAKDVPFGHVVATVAPPRDASRTPLCQVLLTYQDARRRRMTMGRVGLDQFHVEVGHAQTDFMFWIKEYESGLKYGMVFASDLFDAATVDRMLESFRLILGGIVADPERRLSDLPVQSDADARRQFEAGQGREMHHHRGTCLHQLVQRSVRRDPEATALRYGEERWSRRALDEASNRIAQRLRASGIGPGALVAVCLERSPRLVAALLGVLKAGAAYLPLDPAYPPARLTALLEDARARMLIGDAETSTRFDLGNSELLDLDKEHASLAALDGTAVENLADPSDLAYVMYTSGSTGKPKGVMIEHRNVVNLLEGMADQFRSSSGRGVSLTATSISFDVSVCELFGSLAYGFEVVLAADPRAAQRQGVSADLPSLIEAHGVTHFQCTPSQAVLLLAEPSGCRALARLEQILLGGEAVSAELAAELRRIVPGRVLNGYGPTEATVFSTVEEVRDVRGAVPLGDPLPNVAIYILDERLRPVPVGVPGELVIGGEGVGRGYYGQPELTARRFLPDPHRAGGDARMYRSGDVVRRRSDGKLEFLGRNDHQVKIRGFRIELGEIENLLEQHSAVREAVVSVHRLGPTDQRLVAYVRLRDHGASASELREHLAGRLPGYMVPAAVVVLESFPLTPNNKIDRAALPLPDSFLAEPSAESNALSLPRGDQELRLAKLWAQVLGVPKVGMDDDFFALGGHSLLVLEMVRRFRLEFGRDLPLALMFAHPTVRGLAAALDVKAGEGPSVAILLNGGGPNAPIFCICGVHLYQDLAGEIPNGHPVYGIFIPADDAVPDIQKLARHYVEIIQRTQPTGPYHLVGYCFGGVIAYEAAVMLREAGHQVGSLSVIESYLHRGWKVRLLPAFKQGVAALFRRGPRRFLQRLRRLIRQTKGAKPPSGPGQVEPFLGGRGGVMNEIEQAYFSRATRLYEKQIRPYAGRILHFKAADEPETPIFEVQPGGGYSSLARGGIATYSVPGTHQGILKRQHAARLAVIIAREVQTGALPTRANG